MTIRSLLRCAILKRQIPISTPVALLLSGGMDSFSIGIVLKDLGYDVRSYTFHLKDNYSYDARRANEIAERFNFTHTEVEIDASSIVDVYNDLSYLIMECGANKKTLIECLYPHLKIRDRIQEKFIFSGLWADGHFGMSKGATITAYRSSKEFNDLRYDYFYGDKSFEKFSKYGVMYSSINKELISPYLDDDIYEYFISKTHDDMNKPRQKAILRDCFVEELSDIKINNHINYQKGANICEVFKRYFLGDPEYNPMDRKNMQWVYNDWVKKRC